MRCCRPPRPRLRGLAAVAAATAALGSAAAAYRGLAGLGLTRSTPAFGANGAAHLRQRCVRGAVVADRESALRTLGLEGSEFDEPPVDEVKRAFRQEALRWHPDSPGGNAERFQEVRDAYELLLNRRTVLRSIPSPNGMQPSEGARVWEDGVLDPKFPGSPGGTERSGLQGITLLLPAIVAVLVFGLGYVGFTFLGSGSSAPPQEGAQVLAPMKVVRQRSKPLRGMEYVLMAGVAGRQGGEFILLGEATPGAEPPQQAASLGAAGPKRATELAAALTAAWDERADSGKAKYGSITAVVAETEFYKVLKLLREAGDEQLDEGRFPYLLFSGRPVARFERTATGQELLIVGAYDYRRPLPDPIDGAFARTMADEHPPDLLVLDLSEAAWSDLSGEFASTTNTQPWQGLRPRGPISAATSAGTS